MYPDSFYSIPSLCELVERGEKEQLEDLLCQDYPPEHQPYKKIDLQNALHLLLAQKGCDNEILQWILDTGISPNKPCPAENASSSLYKATYSNNAEAVKVSNLNFSF